ncbi:phosphotransferase [Fodinicola acaciae]|uniref:phosphotransferase n=1 Tax=Fodinicola acaciae TaxID=2681555 RepID=UPI0013D8D962|nr:phosphotransferase [Fodinicola acaciae]
MRERPSGLADDQLWSVLPDFGIAPEVVAYAPVGFGDYHWRVTDKEGGRWFVTAADLTQKDYLGPNPLAGLRRAMDTAARLADDGLDYVVAPVRSAGGDTVVRVGARHALSVFPLLDAGSGGFDQSQTVAEHDAVLTLLADLHSRRSPPETPVFSPEIAGRHQLAEALADPRWTGGPFSRQAQEIVDGNRALLTAAFDEFDRLGVAVRGRPTVVTHGEPHPGNLVWPAGKCRLVDWDTVGLAVPERDLSVVSGDLGRYAEISGHQPDPAALRLFDLRWPLVDICAFVGWFRAQHARTADAETGWGGLVRSFEDLATILGSPAN